MRAFPNISLLNDCLISVPCKAPKLPLLPSGPNYFFLFCWILYFLDSFPFRNVSLENFSLMSALNILLFETSIFFFFAHICHVIYIKKSVYSFSRHFALQFDSLKSFLRGLAAYKKENTRNKYCHSISRIVQALFRIEFSFYSLTKVSMTDDILKDSNYSLSSFEENRQNPLGNLSRLLIWFYIVTRGINNNFVNYELILTFIWRQFAAGSLVRKILLVIRKV